MGLSFHLCKARTVLLPATCATEWQWVTDGSRLCQEGGGWEVTATSLHFSTQEGGRLGERAGNRSEQVTGLQIHAAVAPGNVETAAASAPLLGAPGSSW